ncbi:DUF1127 domain-containing protein [Azospirillum thermophilum]|uniref:DUF1127 domain-containing protein n=1 Tax=Azospirillum thermophilum TaxID=2202148 RepID=UPI001FE4375D|nr:DUF1127 domain-containing protein [Azospirillum thermophilum]
MGSVRKATAAGGWGWLEAALATLATWRERSRQRRALGELDGFLLRDIGVSPADARREAGKSFWER